MFYFLAEAAETAPVDGGMDMGGTILMLLAMVAIFYFMLIRPENKRKKEAEEMRNSLKVGDKITTIGGIMGTVVDIKSESFVIETSADQVRVEFAKWALSTNDTAAERAAEAQKKLEEDRARAKAEKKAEREKKKKEKKEKKEEK